MMPDILLQQLIYFALDSDCDFNKYRMIGGLGLREL